MKTLIKWPGGKSEEVGRIEEFVPSEFDRYIEPFFGGGAVFWALRPERAVLNDISTELMDFYRFVGGHRDRAAFERRLVAYVDHWERLDAVTEALQDDVLALYYDYRDREIDRAALEREVGRLVEDRSSTFERFDPAFCVDRDALVDAIEDRLTSKLVRTSDEVDEDNDFPEGDVLKNVETGIRSGFYTHFRDVLNRAKLGDLDLPRAQEIANYFFIREFCYGSMFRYNSKGEFNIPYGGIAYNDKDLRRKVDRVLAEETRELLARAELHSEDFEAVLEAADPGPDDLVFFDPPYDTAFSGYNGDPFDEADHRRLGAWIRDASTQFILVIQNTELIQSLYGGVEGINIESFDKQYAYNVRDRNERDAEHLIIHNLERDQQSIVQYTGTRD